MKIDCISDLHGQRPNLPGGDILIVAGDLTARDSKQEYTEFAEWYLDQPYRKKVLIAGNHDTKIQNGDYYFNHEWLGYLCDSGTEFEGLKIWGSPWTKRFPGQNPHCMAFTVDMYESMESIWNNIPDDTDILVTHSPPFGIFDGVGIEYGVKTGDMNLKKTIDRIKPELVCFGHIHEHGGKYVSEEGVLYVNGSIVDERYRKFNNGRTVIFDEKMPKMQRFKVVE